MTAAGPADATLANVRAAVNPDITPSLGTADWAAHDQATAGGYALVNPDLAVRDRH
ncbi:hypothetical protein [Nocardiopsis synnemataformans]|uniref:hypothetical protein n=1 Tax=Nocardiopsis synnemataformans TaxID=61305 RepID=UPI003EB833BA